MLTALAACDESFVAPDATGDGNAAVRSTATATATLQATALSRGEILVTWPDVSNRERGYEVHRAPSTTSTFVLLTRTGANVTSYNDGSLQPGSQYCYEVRTYEDAGRNTKYGAFSNVGCATTFQPILVAPIGVDALALADDGVRVSWLDNNTAETGFRVQRSAGADGPWSSVATAGPDATSSITAVASREQLACFRVLAFDTIETSPPSTPDCTAIPAAPGWVSAVVIGESIELRWTDNSDLEDGYRISRRTDFQSWTVIATLPSNSNSYRDEATTLDVHITYSLSATRDSAESYASSYASAVIASAPPSAPTEVQASYDPSSYCEENCRVYVSWTESSTNVATYLIERSIDDGTTWQNYAINDWSYWGSGTYFTDWNVGYGQSVCYRVIASNNRGSSEASNVACTVAISE